MKVLRVISSMDPASGGPCQGIRNAAPELLKQDVQTDVVCLDSPDEPFLKNESFPLTALGPSKSAWFYNQALLPWLLENLNKYDAVIVHGLWQYHGYAVNKAINILRKGGKQIPCFFVMPHGMLDPYFQKASDRKLKALRNILYWKFIESQIVNKADGVLFTCQTELRLARKTFSPYRPQNELNVGYGIETPPAFDMRMKNSFEARCPEIGGKPYILFISRIHLKKGVDLLVNAYAEIIKNSSDAIENIPFLVIAGPGLETDYGLSIKQMADNNPEIKDRIFFPGMLSGDTKWGAFYGCEVYILPSHQENFGISVAEALACGKPVLISDQVNIWSEIKAAGAGVVAKDSLQGTIELLSEWLSLNREKREEMRVNAIASFKDEFAIQSAAARFANTLNDFSQRKQTENA